MEKIRKLLKIDQNNVNFTTVGKICGTHCRTIGNIWKYREALLMKKKFNACATVKRPLKARNLPILVKVLDFLCMPARSDIL